MDLRFGLEVQERFRLRIRHLVVMVRVREWEMHCENPHKDRSIHMCVVQEREREIERETQSERECERVPEDTRAVSSANPVLCVLWIDFIDKI